MQNLGCGTAPGGLQRDVWRLLMYMSGVANGLTCLQTREVGSQHRGRVVRYGGSSHYRKGSRKGVHSFPSHRQRAEFLLICVQ